MAAKRYYKRMSQRRINQLFNESMIERANDALEMGKPRSAIIYCLAIQRLSPRHAEAKKIIKHAERVIEVNQQKKKPRSKHG